MPSHLGSQKVKNDDLLPRGRVVTVHEGQERLASEDE